MILWIDRSVTAGIIALIVFTPIAVGGVHPPAYSLMEAGIFALVLAWMAKEIVARAESVRYQDARVRALAVPPLLFLVFVALQLVPMPPSVERAFSPSTYRVYANTLPGWPDRVPYSNLARILSVSKPATAPVILPSTSEAQNGAPVPSVTRPSAPKAGVVIDSSIGIWRPLSINPLVTWAGLLKIAAYVSLFFLVLLYPFGQPCGFAEEAAFYARIIVAVILMGLLVAAIALVEQVTWNGKILWTVIPYDWGAPRLEAVTRARGPFVNPDHLAAYLNLVLPLAVAGVLFPNMAGRKNRDIFRVLCGLTAFLGASALIMSLSRAGWIGLFLGFITFVALCGAIPPEDRPRILRMRRRVALPLAVAGVGTLVLVSALFIGPEGRRRADVRLKETVAQQVSLPFRLDVWRDTLPMIRDFPVFGIGLDGFEDLYPHYQSPPWVAARVTAAHNDYLQLAAETGVVGSALMCWFFVAAGRRLYRGLGRLAPAARPLSAALLAAAAVVAFHEVFDFSLHIPAVALLFTVLLAISLRLTGLGPVADFATDRSAVKTRLIAGAISIAAVALIVMSLRQDPVPYPYNVGNPASPTEAVRQTALNPASFRAHYGLLQLIGSQMPRDERLKEIKAAVWLEPTNPYVRDAHVQTLLESGRRPEALSEMKLSVRNAPPLREHLFLGRRLISWLAQDQRRAVKEGLQVAVSLGYAEAVEALGSFCWTLQDYLGVAAVYSSAAAVEDDPRVRARFLTEAGYAYLRSNNKEIARTAWRSAITADPTFAPAYASLIEALLVDDRDDADAAALISHGIDAGADPVALYDALATAQRKVGDNGAAESSLLKALSYRPSDFDVLWNLGGLYLNDHEFDRAALYIAKATDVHPKSADAFFRLGIAQEGAYHYADAETAYKRALALDSQNPDLRNRYDSLRRKLGARTLPAELSKNP